MKGKILMLVLPLAALLAGPAVARADDELVGAKSADRTVRREAKVILGMAYPTNKGLKNVDLDEARRLPGGGYALRYTFDYTDSDRDPADMTLDFVFDQAGKLQEIRIVNQSSFFPPFLTAKLFLEVIKAALRNDPKMSREPDVQKLLMVNDPREFLVAYLNFKNGRS